ncbi:MAG TPA: ABC transporter permease [Candidatus Angelobacter sp.]
MQPLFQDIRYALRQLRNAPVFTLTAVLTLALGIGANSAVFTLVHEVLLKSLPVADPGGLYRVGDRYECCVEGDLQHDWTMFSYPQYEYLRDHTPEFEQLAASQTNRPDLSIRREGAHSADSFSGELVSGNYFSTLGVQSAAGRLIAPADDQPGAPLVAVMSYRAWQQKYDLDRAMIGSNIIVNNLSMTLIGIAPPGFFGDRLESDPPDFWMPLHVEPTLRRENSLLELPATAWLYLIGRLRTGTQLSQVSAHMTGELQQFLSIPANRTAHQDPADLKKQFIRVTSGASGVNAMEDQYRQGLYVLLAASAVILLIACANVANLLLARATATRFRTSLQLAIGASRGRIIRARLTESVVLAVLGGASGLLVAYFATRAMLALAFRSAQFVPVSATPSTLVLAFTFAVSLLTGIIFGVVPAWMASRSDPVEALRGAGRASRDRSALPQKGLVIVQASLSLVLLTVAGLLTRSLSNLQNQQFWFERQGRLLVQINPNAAGYTAERLTALYQQIENRFSHTPGVISESLSLYTAQQGNNWGEEVYIPGRSGHEDMGSSWDRVSAHYFETIGTPIIHGRGFRESDTATSQRVAVVNEAFVKRFFPNIDAVGQHFGKDDPAHAGDYEIVGVAKDAKYLNPAEPARAMFFVPLSQPVKYSTPVDQMVESASMYMGTIELHVATDPKLFEGQVRRILAEIDPNLVPLTISSFDEQIQERTAEKVLLSRLSSFFGVIALLLASIGLYGLTAYQVERRTGEIGIRMALGANRLSILNMVLRGAFTQVTIGLAIGIPLVFLCGKLLAHQLFGVGSFEPVLLTLAIAVLAFCALLASVVPARRAAAVDPMRALRTE